MNADGLSFCRVDGEGRTSEHGGQPSGGFGRVVAGDKSRGLRKDLGRVGPAVKVRQRARSAAWRRYCHRSVRWRVSAIARERDASAPSLPQWLMHLDPTRLRVGYRTRVAGREVFMAAETVGSPPRAGSSVSLFRMQLARLADPPDVSCCIGRRTMGAIHSGVGDTYEPGCRIWATPDKGPVYERVPDVSTA